MRIAVSRHGVPFLSISLLLFVGAFALTRGWSGWTRSPLLICCLALFILLLSFFRDPERVTPEESRGIVAPADGMIIKIGEEAVETFPGKRGVSISIFMSLWDVHVNRVPISGKVKQREYRRGRFLPAFRDEASHQNEQCSLVIEDGERSVLLRQVSGILARRIITYPQVGDSIRKGDRLGMILFGSRLDLVVPPETTLMVSKGQRTVAGQTIMGVL